MPDISQPPSEDSPLLDAIRSGNSWSNLKADIGRIPSLFTSDTFKGFVQGNTSGLLGAPIDILNTLISPVTKRLGVYTPTPVGGAQSFRNLFSQGQEKDDPIQSTYGSLYSPSGALKTLGVAIPAAKAMLVAAYRTKDPDIMIKAAQMDKFGATGEAIYQATGMYKAPVDNQWRAVLDSGKAEITAPLVAIDKGVGMDPALGSTKLSKVLKFPELFAAYPELRDVTVVPKASGELGSARYLPLQKTLEIAPQANSTKFTSVLLHEVQHGIQTEEGFARGGSQAEFFSDRGKFITAAGKLRKDYNAKTELLQKSLPAGVELSTIEVANGGAGGKYDKFIASPAYQEWKAQFRQIETLQDYANYAFEKYTAMAGEAEARAAQNIFESSKTNPGRKIDYPLSKHISPEGGLPAYDTPVSKLIDADLDARPRDSTIQPLLDAILKK